MNARWKKHIGVLAACATVTIIPNQVSASGFALIEQSVSGLGNAYAGGAAIAEDASTVFFNPAGMTRLGDSELVGALHYINPSTKFKDSGASSETGGDGGEAGDGALVPNVYYVSDMGNNLVFGLGVNAPFGLSTEYDPDWKGRYHGIKSEVQTLNINPSIAYKVDDSLSLGAGISIQQLTAELSNANFTPLGDVLSTIEADGIGYGFNAGALWKIGPDSRLGISYRSKIAYTLEGDVKFTNVPAPALPSFPNGNVEADIDLPASLSLSAVHEMNPNWTIMGDISWTQWSVLDQLVIKFDKGLPASTSTEVYNWDDTLRYSIGASYRRSDTLVLRGGLAFDETPIQSETERGVRVPGNDRTWISLGVGIRPAGGPAIDIGYAHLIVDDADINNTDSLGHQIVGTYEASVDILSVQGSWKF